MLLNSVIGIVNRLRAERPKNYVSFSVKGEILFLQRDQTGPKAPPASYAVCIWASLSAGKVAGLEAGQSSASNAEFKNKYGYTSSPACTFVVCMWATLFTFICVVLLWVT